MLLTIAAQIIIIHIFGPTRNSKTVGAKPLFYADCKVNFTDFALLAEDWLESTYIEDLAELTEDWLECNFALQEDCW